MAAFPGSIVFHPSWTSAAHSDFVVHEALLLTRRILPPQKRAPTPSSAGRSRWQRKSNDLLLSERVKNQKFYTDRLAGKHAFYRPDMFSPDQNQIFSVKHNPA